MIFFMFFIFVAYLLFPVFGFLQFKSENAQIIEEQRIRFRIRDMLRSKSDQESMRLIKWGIWACIAAFLSIVPLLGLPGGVLISVYQFVHLLPERKLSGDMMWPMAILMSIVIPLAWPLALFVKIAMKRFWNLTFKYTIEFVILIWLLLPILWIRLII